MVYVGHSKFRWRPMQSILQAIEPVRAQLGRIALVGHGWAALPAWAAAMHLENAYYSDCDYLRKLKIEILKPIPFEAVIDWMSTATFNPVITRPTFEALRIVTPRFFETPAANTFPIFGLDAEYVSEIYGPAGKELVVSSERGGSTLLNMIENPHCYIELIEDIRHHLAGHHTQLIRLAELIEIIES